MVLNDELSLFTEDDSNRNPYWALSGNIIGAVGRNIILNTHYNSMFFLLALPHFM